MHTLLNQIRAQIGNVKEYINKGHHHRTIVAELEKIDRRFAEYEQVAALAAHDAAQPGDVSVAGKRSAEGYLCYAWGETDLPVAMFAADRSGVFRFLVCEWFGDAKDPELPAAMERLDNHDFREEPLEWKFEIGGVRIERVYGYEALTVATPPPTTRQPAKQGEGGVSYIVNRLRMMADDLDTNDEATVQAELRAFADSLASHPAQATIKDGAAQAVGEAVFQALGVRVNAKGYSASNVAALLPHDMAETREQLMGRILAAACPALTAEIARLRKDAERWQFFRKVSANDDERAHKSRQLMLQRIKGNSTELDFDAAIDTAIRASRGEGL